jgi:hypothetical protein
VRAYSSKTVEHTQKIKELLQKLHMGDVWHNEGKMHNSLQIRFYVGHTTAIQSSLSALGATNMLTSGLPPYTYTGVSEDEW